MSRDDLTTIDGVIHALYGAISGPAGARDWDRSRALFVRGARMMPAARDADGAVRFEVHDVESYRRSRQPYFDRHSFYEREVARRTETFGAIAHVLSTYESRHERDDVRPFMRGINSVQLVWAGGRWWIASLVWQHEAADVPLPARYLPRTGPAAMAASAVSAP